MATPTRRIPLQNLYYLLCYAWDVLPAREEVYVAAEPFTSLPNLLARVLLNGTAVLFRRGLPGGYVRQQVTYEGLKGKVLWAESVRTLALPRQRAVCTFEEFSSDILPNQLLKATLERLIRTPEIETGTRRDMAHALRLLAGIRSVSPTDERFREARRQYLPAAYRLLLSVCELFHHQLLPNEKTGTYRFQSFEGDERQMGYLFEAFVRNFCRRELPQYRVRREHIAWQWQATEIDRQYLPRMETDVSLEDAHRKLIIDAKFYVRTLQVKYDARKLHAPHLYQLFAYLKNHVSKKPCEGLLLYPVVNESLSLEYHDDRHRIRVATLDLGQDWREIHEDLVRIVTTTPPTP